MGLSFHSEACHIVRLRGRVFVENKSASGKRNILIVGKEYLFCSLVEYILEFDGYEVEKACDVTGASEQLEAKTPDLIVLDSMMSEAESLKFLKALKRLPRYSNIPVVVAISEATEESRGTAFEAEANGVLIKPVLMTELQAAVEEFVPL
jgi:two-component system phosphate regulon response regulator PhoB